MSFTYSGLSQYFILNKQAYTNLETKSEQALYFISDTQEIFRGTVNYTSCIKVVASLPNNPLTSKVYLRTSDNTLNIYTGSAWINFGSLNNSVSNTVESGGTATSLAVSGVGIKNYVEDKLEIDSLDDVTTTTLYNNFQLPLTITQTKNSVSYTCTFSKSLDNARAMGCKCTYTLKQGSTTKSTNYWYPGNYNEYANSIDILTDIGTAALTNLTNA